MFGLTRNYKHKRSEQNSMLILWKGGEKRMNRKILLTVMVLVAVAMLAASFNLAFAETINVDYEGAGGGCIIIVPGSGTWIRLAIGGQMHGNYYSANGHGAERIQIYVRSGGSDASPTWKSVSAYEDNPARCAFSAGLGVASEVEHLVKPGQIQVLREGGSNTIMVHWNIPLECLATGGSNPTPAVTIPPGKLVLEGYGDIMTATPVGPVSFGSAGWTIAYSYHYYRAEATLFCVDWNYKWEPVGQLPAESPASLLPRAVVDRVWTWTHA
jgi:hypothetical protein